MEICPWLCSRCQPRSKKGCQGCFSHLQREYSLIPAVQSPGHAAQAWGDAPWGNAQVFWAWWFRAGAAGIKTSTSQSLFPSPSWACAPWEPPAYPTVSHGDGFAAPSTPCSSTDPPGARNSGEKLGFKPQENPNKSKKHLPGRCSKHQGAAHLPAQHSQFPLSSQLAEPRFPCKNEFLKSLEKLIHVHSPRKLMSKLK